MCYMVYIIYYILYIIYNINLLYMSHIRYYIYNIYYMLHLIYYIKPHPIYNIPGGVSLSLSLSPSIYIYICIWGRAKPHPIWNTACATTSIYLAKNGSLLTSFSGWYGAFWKPSGGSKSPISCPTSATFNHVASLPNKAHDIQHMHEEIYNIKTSWFCSSVCV